jgi:hypothetical protein
MSTVSYAAPLYLHAINIVLPPDAASASAASVEEQCRGPSDYSNPNAYPSHG